MNEWAAPNNHILNGGTHQVASADLLARTEPRASTPASAPDSRFPIVDADVDDATVSRTELQRLISVTTKAASAKAAAVRSSVLDADVSNAHILAGARPQAAQAVTPVPRPQWDELEPQVNLPQVNLPQVPLPQVPPPPPAQQSPVDDSVNEDTTRVVVSYRPSRSKLKEPRPNKEQLAQQEIEPPGPTAREIVREAIAGGQVAPPPRPEKIDEQPPTQQIARAVAASLHGNQPRPATREPNHSPAALPRRQLPHPESDVVQAGSSQAHQRLHHENQQQLEQQFVPTVAPEGAPTPENVSASEGALAPEKVAVPGQALGSGQQPVVASPQSAAEPQSSPTPQASPLPQVPMVTPAHLGAEPPSPAPVKVGINSKPHVKFLTGERKGVSPRVIALVAAVLTLLGVGVGGTAAALVVGTKGAITASAALDSYLDAIETGHADRANELTHAQGAQSALPLIGSDVYETSSGRPTRLKVDSIDVQGNRATAVISGTYSGKSFSRDVTLIKLKDSVLGLLPTWRIEYGLEGTLTVTVKAALSGQKASGVLFNGVTMAGSAPASVETATYRALPGTYALTLPATDAYFEFGREQELTVGVQGTQEVQAEFVEHPSTVLLNEAKALVEPYVNSCLDRLQELGCPNADIELEVPTENISDFRWSLRNQSYQLTQNGAALEFTGNYTLHLKYTEERPVYSWLPNGATEEVNVVDTVTDTASKTWLISVNSTRDGLTLN